MKPAARVCKGCGKSKSCFAYRYEEDGKAQRDYWHLACFRNRVPNQTSLTHTSLTVIKPYKP